MLLAEIFSLMVTVFAVSIVLRRRASRRESKMPRIVPPSNGRGA